MGIVEVLERVESMKVCALGMQESPMGFVVQIRRGLRRLLNGQAFGQSRSVAWGST